jgi:hypothetical protein
VKLSSATDAYPGPDLDDRPKFNVAIIYEDSAAGKRAKHFYDRVIRELECDFSLELWNFQVLAVPEIGNSAAKAAAQADFVILSMNRKAQLSVQTRDWIERWSGLIGDDRSALVALLGDSCLETADCDRRRLHEQHASRRSLECHRRGPARSLPAN